MLFLEPFRAAHIFFCLNMAFNSTMASRYLSMSWNRNVASSGKDLHTVSTQEMYMPTWVFYQLFLRHGLAKRLSRKLLVKIKSVPCELFSLQASLKFKSLI
jgi:hypothetical protein